MLIRKPIGIDGSELTLTTGESIGGYMTKKRVVVHAECPACACGDISFIPPEKMKDKFIGNPKEVDILCPTCGTKTTGKVSEEKK
jgi:hypothetical protein